jgi:bacteriocin-like protein
MPDDKNRPAAAAKAEKVIAAKTKVELTDEELTKVVGGATKKKKR